jgi:hypothetical protein
VLNVLNMKTINGSLRRATATMMAPRPYDPSQLEDFHSSPKDLHFSSIHNGMTDRMSTAWQVIRV